MAEIAWTNTFKNLKVDVEKVTGTVTITPPDGHSFVVSAVNFVQMAVLFEDARQASIREVQEAQA